MINTPHQAKYVAHELQRNYANDNVAKLAGLLFDAQVEPKPHQIDAALFALQTPFLKGVILADEVGLGKTIEAGLVISQYWAERKRKILIVTPSSLRQQWQQELLDKFYINSIIVDASYVRDYRKKMGKSPFHNDGVFICSYEYANHNKEAVSVGWDLVVADEAHKLRNYWNNKDGIASSVAEIVKGARKIILLTATPLQNKLEELFGLVSVIDPKYFYSLDAFKERYIKNRAANNLDDLQERVAQIAKRTLRSEAQKYINYTDRLPITIQFESKDEEKELYDKVNDYLQRDEIFAFSPSQRHLGALILRKRLGSSTYAVTSTLENIANRMEVELYSGKRRDNRGGLFVDEDLYEDEVETIEGINTNELYDNTDSTRRLIQGEITELREFASIAKSIKKNAKGEALQHALQKGFIKLAELGAPRKAIIFTESTKTQEYIAGILKEQGYDGKVVLFNGSNNTPESTKIYQDWRNENEGSDIITGIDSSDRRKAIVDKFKSDDTEIMIATEAASEGINLQFCSMIVNYDLPWNPQRVEQRIGRCHRYGQKFDVVVVNFSNQGNIAEQRILELLETKFQLFKNTFGASNDVLGSIENGFDFEKQIAKILDTCRTDREVNAAFEILKNDHQDEITAEQKKTRVKVFDNLDPDVQDRLKTYNEQSEYELNKFERLLIELTKYQLGNTADFESNNRIFHLHGNVGDAPLGTYYFKTKEVQTVQRARQYRFAGPLAENILSKAKSANTPLSHITFSIEASDRASSTAKSFIGAHGTMMVKLVKFNMEAKYDDVSESYIVAAGISDEGQNLDAEHIEKILSLACISVDTTSKEIPDKKLNSLITDQIDTYQDEVKMRNAQYYDQQEEILQRNKEDRGAESEGKIRDLRSKITELRRQVKSEQNMEARLKLKHEAQKLEDKIEDEIDKARDSRREFNNNINSQLASIELALSGSKSIEDLFTIEWSVIA